MFKNPRLLITAFLCALLTVAAAAFADPRRHHHHHHDRIRREIASVVRVDASLSSEFLAPSSPDCSREEPPVTRTHLIAIGFSGVYRREYTFRLVRTREEALAGTGGTVCIRRMPSRNAPAFWVNGFEHPTFYLAITTTSADEGISELGRMLIDRGVMVDGEPMAVVYQACVTVTRPTYRRTCVYRVESRVRVRGAATAPDASSISDGSTDDASAWPPHVPDGVVDPWDGAPATTLNATVPISNF